MQTKFTREDIIAAIALRLDPNTPKMRKIIIKDGKAMLASYETKNSTPKFDK